MVAEIIPIELVRFKLETGTSVPGEMLLEGSKVLEFVVIASTSIVAEDVCMIWFDALLWVVSSQRLSRPWVVIDPVLEL